MPSNSGSSVHSFSVKSETKEKFDFLLKSAIQRNKQKSISKEKLIEDIESTTASSDLLDKDGIENIELADLNEKNNENYILSKFLEGQNKSREGQSSVSVKPPVPKPRTKKCPSVISQKTFEITSPKIIQELKQDSSSSNKTYNVEEIGDVLVHESPSVSKIIKKTAYAKQLRTDSFTHSEDEIKTDSDEDKSSAIDKETVQVVKAKDLREVEKPKPRVRTKINEKDSDDEKAVLETNKYTYEKTVEIVIHKTDRLELSSLVVHPVVKIHVVEANSGKYFPKSDKTRSVVFFYENDDTDYISPVMTHACNLQEKRILYPSWEESILLNEDYEYLKNESSSIMIFFEVLDFLSFSMLQQLNEKECTRGWHCIAFAFLKLSGKDKSLNIGKKVQLQLYYSHQTKKYNLQNCTPWIWWKKKKLKKYPSSLHVTIKPIISPTKVVESFRSKTPVQRETSSKTKLFDDSHNISVKSELPKTASTSNVSETKSDSFNWKRRSNEICKLPNNCLTKLSSDEQGCFVMRFSNNGNYLACSVQRDNLFYIIVYSIQLLREVNKFCCHQALIYSIRWSYDDSLLLSASADNTVSVFQIFSKSHFQILPHPSFVYACDISNDKIIASGCYDGIIRIWNKSEKSSEYCLFQELEAHSGYITTLCFSKKSNIFSADSLGIIIEWQLENGDWIMKRQISVLDLRETVINQIKLFSKDRKLLVHSRDHLIRIIDAKSGCVLQWLRGSLNKRFQIFPTISPCGNYIFSGDENGLVHVWNAKNGSEIAIYTPYDMESKFLTIHCVEFHPCDNILAISHYGRNVPILLYNYEPSLQQPSINVAIKEEYSIDSSAKSSKPELKLKEVVRKSIKSEEKLDFKGILQKMDSVIMSQKINE